MERAEVIRLFMMISDEYPNFITSEENITRHHKELEDFPFETAVQNVERHIKISSFIPKSPRSEDLLRIRQHGNGN